MANDPLARAVGRALAEHRSRSGRTLKQIGDELGVAPASLSNVETGRANPTLARLARIAEAYGATLVIEVIEAWPREKNAHA